jgi:hypothetical protein
MCRIDLIERADSTRKTLPCCAEIFSGVGEEVAPYFVSAFRKISQIVSAVMALLHFAQGVGYSLRPRHGLGGDSAIEGFGIHGRHLCRLRWARWRVPPITENPQEPIFFRFSH